jgi:hypothetical protein
MEKMDCCFGLSQEQNHFYLLRYTHLLFYNKDEDGREGENEEV